MRYQNIWFAVTNWYSIVIVVFVVKHIFVVIVMFPHTPGTQCGVILMLTKKKKQIHTHILK